MEKRLINSIVDSIKIDQRLSKQTRCSICSKCTITPYDETSENNTIDPKCMANVDGFVRGTFTCADGKYKNSPLDTDSRPCYTGNRDRVARCQCCKYGEEHHVKMSVPKMTENLQHVEKMTYRNCNVYRIVYICKNVKSPEHLHNKYLSCYLGCDEFVARDDCT